MRYATSIQTRPDGSILSDASILRELNTLSARRDESSPMALDPSLETRSAWPDSMLAGTITTAEIAQHLWERNLMLGYEFDSSDALWNYVQALRELWPSDRPLRDYVPYEH